MLRQRYKQPNKRYYGLEKVLKSKILSKTLKIKMYTLLLRPIALYDSEMWVSRKTEESRLMKFKRKVVKNIWPTLR